MNVNILLIRSITILTWLFAIVFAFLLAVAYYFKIDYLIMLPLGVAFVFLEYLISPYFIDKFFKIKWIEKKKIKEVLGEDIYLFIKSICKKYGFPFPKIGIIEDDHPNAFTYGHFRRNARIALTRGLLKITNRDELKAIVGHELGHIKNNDFILMTAVQALVMMMYYIYRTIYNSTLGSGRGGGRGRGFAVFILILSYIMYWASYYLMLMFSRIREYYADAFSAYETRDPNSLIKGLIKVAYNMAKFDTREEEDVKHVGASGLGIFDLRMARGIVFYISGFDSMKAVVDAMKWDLYNPWAFWLELTSTHPLPAKRINFLASIAKDLGQNPFIEFRVRNLPKISKILFVFDVLLLVLPFALPALIYIVSRFILGFNIKISFLVALAGILYLISLLYKYPMGFEKTSIISTIRNIDASPVRGMPVKIKGKIIGRGIPGYFLSEDIVVYDGTAYILVDYRQPFFIFELIFAIINVKKLIGKDCEILGWYRRSIIPYIELYNLKADGESYTCYTLHIKVILAIFAVYFGILFGILNIF